MTFSQGFRVEPAETYHQRHLDIANNGGLALLDTTTPLHFHHWVHSEETAAESATFALGRAYHASVLEPEKFADEFICLPDSAPKDLRRFRGAAKPSQETLDSIAWWDMWTEANAGRTILPAENRERLIGMAASQRRLRLTFGKVTLTLGDLIDACRKEVSAYWIDPVTGVKCKARFDLVEEDLGFLGDLKSAMDAGENAFAKAAARHRYHQQQAHYCEGFREITGKAPRAFSFLPVEKEPPYAAAAWNLGAASHELGYGLQQRALRKLAACLASGQWPGYPETIKTIELPTWAHYELGDDDK